MAEETEAPPEESTLINIASEIPEDKRKEIAKEIVEQYKVDLESRGPWAEKRKKWYDLWSCVRKKKITPWEGASNVCFSLDTEILTDRGWKFIGDVKKGERVYTRDDSGNAFYRPVSSTILEKSDTLIHFTGQSVDIKVTPNHQMLVESERTGKCGFYPAEYFLNHRGSGFIPLWSKYSEGLAPTRMYNCDARAFVRVLGWYIAEGSCGKQKTKNGTETYGTLYIAQKNKKKRKILESDLRAAGFSYRDVSGKGFSVHTRPMLPQLKAMFRSLGRATEKHIPNEFLQLSPYLLIELLETMMLGDGNINKSGFRTYNTSSKQLADDVQELCQKIGKRASISICKREDRPECNPEYIVRICEKHLHTRFTYIDRKVVAGGDVACVEVKPHHTIYVRRNDKPIWCGNCIPMLATACNQFHARAYQSVFAAPGMVRCIPVGSNDRGRAASVEKFLNWQTLYEMEEYEEVFDRTLQRLPINGTEFKKLFYSKTLDRPVAEDIQVLDFVIPYRTKSLKAARRKTHRLWLHYDELLDREEDGLYIDFDKILPEPSGNDESRAALDDAADAAVGQTSEKPSENPHLILETHKKYDLGDGIRMPYIFTVEVDSETLLRCTKARIENGTGIIKDLEYFIDYHFLPNPEGFYSFGFGHFLEPLNEMGNSAFNLIFDSGSLTNQPFGFYGRRAGFKKRKIKLHPGLMTEVEDAKEVYFPSMQRVDQVLFMVLGLVQQYSEQFTSTSDYLMGRESKGTKTPTAHGTLAIIEQGLVTFAVMTKRMFRSLRKELKLLLSLNQLFSPESKQFRVMEDMKKIPFPTIKRADFDAVYDVIPIGDPSYASKESRRREASEIYGMLMQNPLVIGNPKTGEGSNPRAIHKITSTLLETYDVIDGKDVLPELPPEQISPEVENAMMMQGDTVDPTPGEDIPKHVKSHQAFMQSAWYGNMPEAYQKLVLMHLQKTQQLAYAVENGRKNLGGEPPIEPPKQGGNNGAIQSGGPEMGG